MKTENITMRLDAETLKRLAFLAKQYGRSRADVLQLAITELSTPQENRKFNDLLDHLQGNVLGMAMIVNRRNLTMIQLARRIGELGMGQDAMLLKQLGEFGTAADVAVEKEFTQTPDLIQKMREQPK